MLEKLQRLLELERARSDPVPNVFIGPDLQPQPGESHAPQEEAYCWEDVG